MWAVTATPLSPERATAFADSTRLVALHLLRQRAGADVERRLRADLLATVLRGERGADEAAARLGLASGPSVVLALAALDESDVDADLEASRQRLADAFAVHLSAVHSRAVAALVGGVAYGILPVAGQGGAGNGADAVRIAREFLERSERRMPAVVGVGRVGAGAAGLARSRADADRVLRVLRREGAARRVATVAEVHVQALMQELADLSTSHDLADLGPGRRLAGLRRGPRRRAGADAAGVAGRTRRRGGGRHRAARAPEHLAIPAPADRRGVRSRPRRPAVAVRRHHRPAAGRVAPAAAWTQCRPGRLTDRSHRPPEQSPQTGRCTGTPGGECPVHVVPVVRLGRAQQSMSGHRRPGRTSSGTTATGCIGWRSGCPGNAHDAEDITQEVFIRVFRSLDTFRPGSFEGWLHRITTNVFLDLVRRRQRIRMEALPEETDRIAGREPSPEQAWHDANLDPDLQAALDDLPPEFRAAVVLCDVEGLSYEEIGATLGVKLGTVRSRIHRGRQALRVGLMRRRAENLRAATGPAGLAPTGGQEAEAVG